MLVSSRNPQMRFSSAAARGLLTVNFHQPSHEFTFGVSINLISYPMVLTPLI
jgi:hypothetical protein